MQEFAYYFVFRKRKIKALFILAIKIKIDFVKNARVMMSFKETTVLPRYIFREDHKMYN